MSTLVLPLLHSLSHFDLLHLVVLIEIESALQVLQISLVLLYEHIFELMQRF